MNSKIIVSLLVCSYVCTASSTSNTSTALSDQNGSIQPYGYHLRLEEVVGTELETVDIVSEMLKGPYASDIDVRVLCKVTRAEVFKFLLDHLFEDSERAETAQRILAELFSSKGSSEFQSGSNLFTIVEYCLKEISKSPLKDQIFSDLYTNFNSFVHRGDIHMVKAFIKAELRVKKDVQETFPFGIFLGSGNNDEMIKALVGGGMSAAGTVKSVYSYMHSPVLTPSLFDFLLDSGLTENYSQYNLNWLELCMKSNRPDLGLVAYKHGVRLPAKQRLACAHAKEFIEALALKIAQEDAFERVRLLLAAAEDYDSEMNVFPKELLIEQAKFILENINADDYIPLISEQNQ